MNTTPKACDDPVPGWARASGHEGLWNWPNFLSALRIAALPVLVVLLLFPGRVTSLAAAMLFALAACTDWLDGYVARRWDRTSAFGKQLDPLADKLLITVTLVMLIPLGWVPAWMVAVVLARELGITGIREIASLGGVPLAVTTLAKYKTALQMVAVLALTLHYPYLGVDFHRVGLVLFGVALAATVISGVDYLWKFLRSVKRG